MRREMRRGEERTGYRIGVPEESYFRGNKKIFSNPVIDRCSLKGSLGPHTQTHTQTHTPPVH